MARVGFIPWDSDPLSPVMSRVAAMKFLGFDEKTLKKHIITGKLLCDQETGVFARKQVEALATEIERRIMYAQDNGTQMGQIEQKAGMLGGLGQGPKMVPVKSGR